MNLPQYQTLQKSTFKASISFSSALLLILLAFLEPVRLKAQVPIVQWDKTVGGDEMDILEVIRQTADGGYLAGGRSRSGISGDKSEILKGYEDYWVVKLNAFGAKEWDRSFGGHSGNALQDVQQTTDGGYILGGSSSSHSSRDKTDPNMGGEDYWLVKLDANGNKLWDKTFGGDIGDKLMSVVQTTDGGFLLGGTSYSGISGHKTQAVVGQTDYWIIKIDAAGNKLWDKTFGGSDHDYLYSVAQASDGGFVMAGSSKSGATGDKTHPGHYPGEWDFWIVKTDAQGNKLWDKTYGGGGTELYSRMQKTADNGYIIGGSTLSDVDGDKTEPSRGRQDYWIVKLDSNGVKQWDKTLGTSTDDEFGTICQTNDGGYMVGGSTGGGISGDKTENPKGSKNYWLIKLSATGAKLWDKTVGSMGYDDMFSLQPTSDNGLIVGGSSWGNAGGDKTENPKGSFDYWIVKLGNPCPAVTAVLTADCKNGSNEITASFSGLPAATTYTLTFVKNGALQTKTGTNTSLQLESNAAPGTVYALADLTFGACNTTLSGSLIVPVLPAPPVVASGNSCNPGSVILTASGAPAGGSYSWYNSKTAGNAVFTSAEGVFNTPVLEASATYYAAIKNNTGCESERIAVTATIETCPPPFIPNIVTQNGDGKNDTFKPKFRAGETWALKIYNRWGVRIFETSRYRNSWPESKLTAGTYYYHLSHPESGRHYKGWVEVQ